MKGAIMPDEDFVPPPEEPQMPAGSGAWNIPELEEPDDDTEYVDPLGGDE
jgi:hypothetical protein